MQCIMADTQHVMLHRWESDALPGAEKASRIQRDGLQKTQSK
jgi:hypothetical protein